jgi:hypothetical protein
MAMIEWTVIWGVIAFAAAILGGILAGVKNRSYSAWIGWCFLVPPLVLVLALLPKNQGPRPPPPKLDDFDHDPRHF